MKRNGLGRLYDRLEPEERFRVDLLAMARGDLEESERLTRTCPKRDYIMNDWAFVGRWQAARDLAMLAYMDLARCMDKITMIHALRETLPYLRTVWTNDVHRAYFDGHEAGSRYAWGKAGMEGEPPGWESDEDEAERNADPATEAATEEWSGKVEEIDERLGGALENLECELARQGFAAWSALSGFCAEEMGVDAHTLMAVFHDQGATRGRELEELATRLELEPDGESVAEYRALMEEVWHWQLAKG
jgi:hypothetical protein